MNESSHGARRMNFILNFSNKANIMWWLGQPAGADRQLGPGPALFCGCPAWCLGKI